MKKYLFILFLLETLSVNAQNLITGIIKERDENGIEQPIFGVSVRWYGDTKFTQTDTTGFFTISSDSLPNKLILELLGYKGDTVFIERPGQYTFFLKPEGKNLDLVIVQGRKSSTVIDSESSYNTKLMNEKELYKAACCNLSESFETNPSVDVNYSDAVSGAKQIQMLGLSGIYTQLTTENLPGTRGLASNFGLSYIPGTWIESIQVTKGIGSVVNGYESVAGQINVELKKPEDSEKLYLNGFMNSMLRTEGNLNLSTKVSKRISTSLLTHIDLWKNKIDFNKDGFLDMPLSNQYSFMNRWKYKSKKGFESQAGIKILSDDRTGGQANFNKETDRLTTNHYGLGIQTKRYEGFAKAGYVWQAKPYKSIGLMVDGLQHETNNYFGLTTYKGLQQSLYGNLIYHSIIKNTNHKFKTGISWMYDQYNEKINAITYKRTESVPGAFVEYTFKHKERLTIVSGFRTDYNSLFGWIFTPRLHAKYNLTEKATIRLAAGRGQRTSNIFAENISYFATSRQAVIIASNSGKGYGLNPEIAWNYGVNFLREFKLNNHSGSFNLDYYRTDFKNQVVVDLDASPQSVVYSNLKGVSYSNSMQAELNYEPFKKFDVRLAYRFYDVKTTYHGQLMERYLLSKHRAFLNLAYATKNKWSFDFTINWNGRKRIPNTQTNPSLYQRQIYSPSYLLMNAQISKKMWKIFDAYVGIENIGNFRQKDLIIAPDAPFGPYFDSSLIWGPVLGRMYYIGFRLKIK
jgi:outer membrane receptor for ferrienterochelin and colicins